MFISSVCELVRRKPTTTNPHNETSNTDENNDKNSTNTDNDNEQHNADNDEDNDNIKGAMSPIFIKRLKDMLVLMDTQNNDPVF